MQLFGIVRDANGKPKFDDPSNAPAEMKAMLTDRDIMLLSETEVAALGLMARRRAIEGAK